jgi:cell division protein FtsB
LVLDAVLRKLKNGRNQWPPSARQTASPWSGARAREVRGGQGEENVNFRQLILGLYLLLFAGLGIAGAVLFKEAHDEYSRLEQVESSNRRRLAEARDHLRDQEKVLHRLQTDPAYVDKVIRMRLGYAKPDEFIFRFEDDDSKGSAGPASIQRNDK